MLKVGVIGAAGRMGSETCRAIEEDPELALVARIGHGDDLTALKSAGAEVAVEFTTPDAVKGNARFCLENSIHTVIGATGLTDEDVAELDGLARARGVGVFIAPNFALGAVLMMRFAAEASRYFDSAEIVERHHERKLDAPSGTALRTARMMTEARDRAWAESAGQRETLEGARGGDESGLHIHSLRVPGSVAHQEVIFGAPGETLTIKHDSLDRTSFMPGVILAVKKVPTLTGTVVGLEHLLAD